MDQTLTTIGTAEITVFRHYYGGCNQEPTQNRFIDAVNPSTGKVEGMVSFGSAVDVDRAVKYAVTAGKDGWSKLNGMDRHALLIRMAELIKENSQRLASYNTADTGKTVTRCQEECEEAVKAWTFYAGLAENMNQGGSGLSGSLTSLRVPKGVVGIILPPVTPLLDFSRYVAAAVACGNTVVVKPSEHSTRSTLALADLTKSAGFPDGVINVICGDGENTGHFLARHAEVDHICFAGSSEAGKVVAASAAQQLSSVTCELSAKNSVVVFDDADLERVADKLIKLAFLDNGQSNLCAQRVLVQSTVKQKLSELLVERVKNVKVGYPKKRQVDVGPLLSGENLDRVDCFIRMAVNDGASILAGGERVKDLQLGEGFYFQPTILDDVTEDMQIAEEETRGPVLTLTEFTTDDEGLKMCAGTRYGMATWVFTESLSRAQNLVKELSCGNILINHGLLSRVSLPICPYGESGLGSNLGHDAITTLTRIKNICFEG